MKTIKQFPIWFSRQKRSAKIFLGVWGVLLVIFLFVLLSTVFSRSNQPAPTATAASTTAADIVVITTWTPTPTYLPEATDISKVTRTPLPTGLPAQSLDTATAVIIPPTISPALIRGGFVVISGMDKQLEYVDIQNVSHANVIINGWTLVSEVGNQICPLKGTLKPKQVLRIWAATGQVGISCGFHNPIWLDQELDPAVLYNANGEEMDRYPPK